MTIKPGLFSTALLYSEKQARPGELYSAACAAAVAYIERTGEAIRTADDVLILLRQAASDPCAFHCDEPVCRDHEK